jgi:hypothetical protein
MPWSCPACGSTIQHDLGEARPRFGVRYRCHLCRLELVMDPATIRLVEPADIQHSHKPDAERSDPLQ